MMLEWKKLGEIAVVSNGERPVSEILEKGMFPYINAGRSNSGYLNEFNSKSGAITTPSHGEGGIGCVLFQNHDFWCGALCYKMYAIEGVEGRYLFHYLSNNTEKILDCKNVGGQPYINRKQLEGIIIGVPSLSEQTRSGGILDTFTASIENLKQQIAERRKQYEYYRDQLLDLEGKEGVEMRMLGEVCVIKNGYTPSTKNPEFWENGTLPWFTLEDIRKNGRILRDAIKHITPLGVKKGGLFPKNSIIVSTTATIGEYALINTDFLCNQQITCLSIKGTYKEQILSKYLYYLADGVGKWCKKNVNGGGSLLIVSASKLHNLTIPIPCLQEQSRIVSILDTFEASIANLESQLKGREKQYEYYRNKLLTFE